MTFTNISAASITTDKSYQVKEMATICSRTTQRPPFRTRGSKNSETVADLQIEVI